MVREKSRAVSHGGASESGAAGHGPMLRAYRVDAASPLRLVPAAARRAWMDATPDRWPYRCLPLVVANQAGWFILNDQAFFATWDGGAKPSSVKFVFPAGRPPYSVASHFGFGIVTWRVPYLMRTSPGYNLLVRGPSNLPKDGIFPLEGIVETDWAVQTFTMNWRFTRPGVTISFSKDEPVCMLVPQRRGDLEEVWPEICDLDDDPELARQHRKFAENRADFLAQHSWEEHFHEGHVPDSQRHYARGSAPGGVHASEHQTKLRLHPFDDHAQRKL